MAHGLEKGIHIHIHMPRDKGLPVVSKAAPMEQEREFDSLLLRLSNKDTLNDQEMSQLTMDVVTFVKSKLAKKDMACLRMFLKEAKHMLSPDMREIISEELKLVKL